MAFSWFKDLIKYRFIVSRINKLFIIFFVLLLGFLFYRRLSIAGKFCSGDHLTTAEWKARFNPHKSREFLVKLGFIMHMYVYAVTSFLTMAFFIGVYMAYAVAQIF